MAEITFGELLRRLRRAKGWELQDVARAASLSISHLSRLENDRALPNPDTVVKLATALDGDLDWMLELARCLPEEILDRLASRAGGASGAPRRSSGLAPADPTFARALVEDIDPAIRTSLTQAFGLSNDDIDGIFAVLQKLGQMSSAQRRALIQFLAGSPTEGGAG